MPKQAPKRATKKSRKAPQRPRNNAGMAAVRATAIQSNVDAAPINETGNVSLINEKGPIKAYRILYEAPVEPKVIAQWQSKQNTYLSFSIDSMELLWTGQYPNTTSGGVVLAYVADPTKRIPATEEGLQMLTSTKGSKVIQLWGNHRLSVTRKSFIHKGLYYSADSTGSGDPRFQQVGKFVVMASGDIEQSGSATLRLHVKGRLHNKFVGTTLAPLANFNGNGYLVIMKDNNTPQVANLPTTPDGKFTHKGTSVAHVISEKWLAANPPGKYTWVNPEVATYDVRSADGPIVGQTAVPIYGIQFDSTDPDSAVSLCYAPGCTPSAGQLLALVDTVICWAHREWVVYGGYFNPVSTDFRISGRGPVVGSPLKETPPPSAATQLSDSTADLQLQVQRLQTQLSQMLMLTQRPSENTLPME